MTPFQNTSTFSTAGRAVTQVGGVPLGVGKAVGKGAIRAYYLSLSVASCMLT